METLLFLVLLAAIGGGFYYYYDTQATKDVIKTTLPAAQIIRQAVQEIGTERRWSATGHSSDYASFTFKQHANCAIAIIFAFFFVVPGILYFLIASRTQTLTINVFPEPEGTSAVQISANGGESKRRGKRFLRGLPQQPARTPQQAEGAPAAPPASVLPAGDFPHAVQEVESVDSLPQAAELDRSPERQLGAQSTKFCEECGAEMTAPHRFCPSCGKKQPAVS